VVFDYVQELLKRAAGGTTYPEQEHWEQEHEMWSLIMSRSYFRELQAEII